MADDTVTPERVQAERPAEPTSTLAHVSPGPGGRDMREQRRSLVSAMLLSRLPYREMVPRIQQRLGIATNLSTIAEDVKVIRTRWRDRMTDDYSAHVDEQMAYFDGLLGALAPKALLGQHDAVQDLLSVLDRRARLLGLDQPERIAFAGVVEHRGNAVDGWAAASHDEQIERTEEVLGILNAAGVFLPIGVGHPDDEPELDVIDVDPLDEPASSSNGST